MAGEWKTRLVHEPVIDGFVRTVWSGGTFDVLADAQNPERFCVSFPDAADFLIDFSEREIRIARSGSCSPQRVRQLLGDQVLPRILAQQGELVLHAAGVESAGGVMLLVGASGSGKSTLAASMRNAGHRLLGDDAIVVTAAAGAVTARAIYRSLRLFPDSISALVDSSAKLSPVAANTSKQNVICFDEGLSGEPLPVRAAFLLAPSLGEALTIEPMSSSEACIAFVEHSFWMDPTDLDRTKERMTEASAAAAAVPTFRLAYPRNYSALATVHRAVNDVLG